MYSNHDEEYRGVFSAHHILEGRGRTQRHWAPFTPCFVLPCQTDTKQRAVGEGERALMVAIVQDAVRCYLGGIRWPRAGRRNRHDAAVGRRRLQQQARDWFMSDVAIALHDFVTICHHLDIDPACFRQALLDGKVPVDEWAARARRQHRADGPVKRLAG